MNDEGLTNSAILLMSIGEEQAAEVLKFLTPKEIQKLGEAMSRLKTVTVERLTEVIDSFNKNAGDAALMISNSDEYVRNVLNKALGEGKALFLVDRILADRDVSGIEGLKWLDADTVNELIKNEHPQIIASILIHLEQDQAADVLGKFTERARNEVLLRIATIDNIQPIAITELNEVLSTLLRGSDKLKRSSLGGVKSAANILNYMGSSAEQKMLESIREHDPELATDIEEQMFTFDNILDLDDRAIQLVLREVQTDALTLALKGTTDEIRQKIFSNMSNRAADMLKDDLESRGPCKVSDVELEQKEILKAVRRLAEDGQISLGMKGEDAYI